VIGVIINTVLVITGGCIGLLLKKGIPDTIKQIIMTGLGLFTSVLGIKMGLEMQRALVEYRRRRGDRSGIEDRGEY
jgi:uncharacterized membrane protein YqgA involved in biofilm formation